MNCMIALYPPPSVAAALAVPGGEPAEELHITLAYFEEVSSLQLMSILNAVSYWASDTESSDFNGKVNGIGEFMNGDENALIALPDLPHLFNMRRNLLSELNLYGVKELMSQNHGFIPHITLKYESSPVDVPASYMKHVDLWFDSVFVVLNDSSVKYEFPLL